MLLHALPQAVLVLVAFAVKCLLVVHLLVVHQLLLAVARERCLGSLVALAPAAG